MKKRSWKTTLCGLLSVLCTTIGNIADLAPIYQKILVAFATFFLGLGLLFARDNNRSSEQVGAGNTGKDSQ